MITSNDPSALATLPLVPPLTLPNGTSEEDIMRFFGSLVLDGGPPCELEDYWRQDWKRFMYTYGLVNDLKGHCLEIGANPYFTTSLLKNFTPLELSLTNYFGPHFESEAAQRVTVTHPLTGETKIESLLFSHFNIEKSPFPFPNAAFEVVLLCEVLEHLQTDPLRVLLEIKRVLKEGGHLILSTPNVSRLENVCRMIAGVNIYDPYSGYGAYGRHNREYNKHELALLLGHCGFDLEILFSADVHENCSANFFPLGQVTEMVRARAPDLGQYLFARARNAKPAVTRRPRWLYRSYPENELEEQSVALASESIAR